MLLFLFSDEVPEEPEVEGKFTFKKPTKRKSEGFIADQVKPAKKKKEKKERTGPKQTKSNKTLLSFGDEEDEGWGVLTSPLPVRDQFLSVYLSPNAMQSDIYCKELNDDHSILQSLFIGRSNTP